LTFILAYDYIKLEMTAWRRLKMREKRLVLEGSVCNCNLRGDGPKTYAEAARIGEVLCPRARLCLSKGLGDYACIMKFGQEVARNVLKEHSTVEAEMAEFRRDPYRPSAGWLYSQDGHRMETVPNGHASAALIERFAHIVLDDDHASTSEDLRLGVGPRFEDVVAHAMAPDGLSIDLAKVQELEGRFGSNGGRGCDVRSGPCSCGAWH
jgi:hypothetical protein